MQKRITATIRGRVQLVMYRDFAMRKARSLGLVGTVHNERDGTVTVVAEGNEADLKIYIEKLKQGSILSKVDDVSVIWGEPVGNFTKFLIVY